MPDTRRPKRKGSREDFQPLTFKPFAEWGETEEAAEVFKRSVESIPQHLTPEAQAARYAAKYRRLNMK